jgi:hypothetical protein
MPHPSRDQRLKQVVARAVTSPVSLFLGTTGLLLAISPYTWPLGLGALALDGAWVWTRVRDPRFVQASDEALLQCRWRDLIGRLEEVTPALDAETAATVSAIVDSQERLLGMYEVRLAALPATRSELTSLLEHCLSLIRKRRQFQHYLASFRANDVQRQARQLQLRVEKTADLVTRQLYEQALDQKRQELENYVRLEEAVSRIDGQLAAVRCTFDNLLSKMIRMEATNAVVAEAAADPVFAELDRLAKSAAALEASLHETLTLRGAA